MRLDRVSSVQSLSCVRLFATLWTAAHQPSLSVTSSWSLLKLMSVELVMASNHLILCCPPLLLPSIFPSIRVFSDESTLRIRWPKYWSFSFSISPSNEYSGLISFRMDWFDRLAVQGTLKSLLQHLSSKASILQHHLIESEILFPWSYSTSGKAGVGSRDWNGWRALLMGLVAHVHFFELTVLCWAVAWPFMPLPFSGVTFLPLLLPLSSWEISFLLSLFFFPNSLFKIIVRHCLPFLDLFLMTLPPMQNWQSSPSGVSIILLNCCC